MSCASARLSNVRTILQHYRTCFISSYKLTCYNYVKVQPLHIMKTIFPVAEKSLLWNQRPEKNSVSKLQCRYFWGLDVAFNKVDEERVKLAGPDRAAAEWILRNEGSLKWVNSEKHLKNYNFLPSTDFQSYKIEEIDLTATNVIGLGFEHLESLKHVRSIILHGCRTIHDDALGHLHFVQDTLEYLDVSRCAMVTEKGLRKLHCLKKLKTLVIYDLIEVKNFDKAITDLSQAMPWCTINTDDPLVKRNDETETK